MFKKSCYSGTFTITEVTYDGLTGTVLPLIEEYKYLQVYRNGLLMTQDIDYAVDLTKLTFIGSIVINETDYIKLILFK